MSTEVEKRNQRAKAFVLQQLRSARETPLSPDEKRIYSSALQVLDRLIPISAMGFRGVVLTGIVGRQLDRNFEPLVNFYDCNPRSIFEQGIYYALQENGIPCGKSDPLNVAKNIHKLDYDWAKGRRPESAARAAVDYLKLLRNSRNSVDDYEALVRLYFCKLCEYAEFVAAQRAPLVAHEGEAPLANALRLARFVVECPEGGTIPQYVVGNLIDLMRDGDHRFKAVNGIGDSVYGTNTTSKKPADAWEVLAAGEIGSLYEITVKKVDLKRLEDCVENLNALRLSNKVVTFLCRVPEDISALPVEGNTITVKGVCFQFLPIDAFIVTSYCSLTEYDQLELMKRVERFIGDPNRKLTTKSYWKTKFGT